MRLLGEVVNTTDLWETVVASLVAGIGVTVIFSLAIWGATHFADFNRDGRSVAAAAAGLVAVLALAATLAAIVLGIVVMTTK